jgi:hypothetical protein
MWLMIRSGRLNARNKGEAMEAMGTFLKTLLA